MEGLQDLLVNIAAGSLSFLLGIGVTKAHSWHRFRRIRRFWRPLTTGGLTLVLGQIQREDLLQYEPSGLVGIGDLRGLHELIEQLGDARLTGFKVEYALTLNTEDRYGNLVLLGGSDTNALTDEFMQKVGAQVEFRNDGEPAKPPILHDNAYDSGSIRPELSNNTVVTDCGVLIRARNPMNPDKWVVIIAGCLGFGTWAGVRLTTTDDLRHAPEAFECIFKATVDSGSPRSITPVAGPRRLLQQRQ
jgi:hypothetical protein